MASRNHYVFIGSDGRESNDTQETMLSNQQDYVSTPIDGFIVTEKSTSNLVSVKRQCCGKLTVCEGLLVWLTLILIASVLGIIIAWSVISCGFKDCNISNDKPVNPCSTSNPHGCISKAATTVAPSVLCDTAACAIMSAHILQNMDATASPCEDFYKFACGRYAIFHNLPRDQPLVSPIQDIEARLYKSLRELLESEDDPTDSKSLAQSFYRSCIQQGNISKKNVRHLKKIMGDLGGWPVLVGPNWTNSRGYTWEEVAARITLDHGQKFILETYVTQDSMNTSRHIVEVDQAYLGLKTPQVYLNGSQSEHMQQYLRFLMRTTILLGGNITAHHEELLEILIFEIELAKGVVPMGRRDRQSMYNPVTLGKLAGTYPGIDFITFITSIYPKSLEVGPDEVIVVVAPEYLTNAERLVRKTSPRIIQNYLLWRLIQTYIPLLPEEFRKPADDFRNFLLGVSSRAPRWEECVKLTRDLMPMVLGGIFVRKHFDKEAKNEINEMVENLQAAFMRSLINEVDWMDNSTKSHALLKAQNIRIKIGYPDRIYNETWLLMKFRDVRLGRDSLLENVRQLREADTYYDLVKLRDPPDREIWFESPAVVDAYYAPANNDIVFPAGILQFPFFLKGIPKYLMYSMVGAVIGHEITHGFDDEGRQHDQYGNLHQWWDEETLSHFVNKSRCLMDQYASIYVPDAQQNLNGLVTLGENIADNGGVKTAFKAYKHWLEDYGTQEPVLPGLQNFTAEQLFFLGYTNNWCSMMRPEAYAYYLNSERHSPPHYRAVIPLMNFEEFSRAFDCPLHSNMNPVDKCGVW